jgi:hypothetical protein
MAARSTATNILDTSTAVLPKSSKGGMRVIRKDDSHAVSRLIERRAVETRLRSVDNPLKGVALQDISAVGGRVGVHSALHLAAGDAQSYEDGTHNSAITTPDTAMISSELIWTCSKTGHTSM